MDSTEKVTDWRHAETGEHATEGAERRRPGKAVAALILGIVGLVVAPIICSTLAIVFGVLARNEIRRDERLTGGSMALWGIALGVLGVIAGIGWIAYYLA